MLAAGVDVRIRQGMKTGLGCGAAAVLFACALSVQAYTVHLAPRNPRTIYLQVGVGSFTGGSYQAGGSPAMNGTINAVSVTVPAAQVGNGTAQAMTTDSAASLSFLDNFAFCNLPGQLYVGGFYRSQNASGGSVAATLVANVPASLTSAGGQTIPFSQISWTSSGNRENGAEPFPAGSFPAGGAMTIGTIRRNRWAESCHTYSFLNSAVLAPGTYTGRVTYTLSAP
jgi:hypothetical protein